MLRRWLSSCCFCCFCSCRRISTFSSSPVPLPVVSVQCPEVPVPFPAVSFPVLWLGSPGKLDRIWNWNIYMPNQISYLASQHRQRQLWSVYSLPLSALTLLNYKCLVFCSAQSSLEFPYFNFPGRAHGMVKALLIDWLLGTELDCSTMFLYTWETWVNWNIIWPLYAQELNHQISYLQYTKIINLLLLLLENFFPCLF